MKKLITTLFILILALSVPSGAYATHEAEHCVQVYGGGVVCGAEDHEPVEAGLGDVNPAVLAGVLLATSGALLYISKKMKPSSSQDIN